jgi:hypothetical protein
MSAPPKPPGCDKNIDGDQLAALKALTSDDMKALINSHAGDKCKNILNDSLKTAIDRGYSTSAWLEDHARASGSAGWSGGSASADVGMSLGGSMTVQNTIDEDHQSSGMTEGCRQTLFNMNESNSLYSQLSCNMKSASNTVQSDIKIGATISIRVGPTDLMVAMQDRKMAGINDNISKLVMRDNLTETQLKALDYLRQQYADAEKSFRFDIKNSTFKITSNNIQKLVTTNNQEIDDATKIKEAITKKAVSEAVSSITQKYEMGAGAVADLESYAGTKINDTSLSTAQDIIAAANDTKISVDMNGNLTLTVNGSLDGINVDITQGNLTELRSELIMKAATDLGRDIAAEIIHEQMTKSTAETEAKGLASYQKAIADGLAEQSKTLDSGGIFGGMFGGMFGKIGMVILGVIIVLVIFMMFGFKIALIVGLILGMYLAVSYFVGWPPFTKENSEQDEDIFEGVMRDIINPRRVHLFNSLKKIIISEEIPRIESNPNSSQKYLDQLKEGLEFIENLVTTNTGTLDTKLNFNRIPLWIIISAVRLEYEIFDELYSMTKHIMEVADPSRSDDLSVIIRIKSVTPKLAVKREELYEVFNRANSMISADDWANKMYNDAFNRITDDSVEIPASWKKFGEDYRDFIKTRTSAQKKDMDQMKAMDNVKAAYIDNTAAYSDNTAAYIDNTAAYPQEVQIAYSIPPSIAQTQSTYTSSSTQARRCYDRDAIISAIEDVLEPPRNDTVAKMVQREYSRKNGKTIKPVYNKNSVFKRS